MVEQHNGMFLEPWLPEIPDGTKVSLVLEVVMQCPKANICRSILTQQLVMTDVDIPANCARFTILQGEKRSSSHHFWVSHNPATIVFGHCNKDVGDLGRIVELCSGIGAVDKGYHFCGANTISYVDSNQKFCDWLTDRGIGPVVCGNIADDNTIAAIAKFLQQGHTISSGVSCQPFSKLGDQRENMDSRSESFTSTLRAGYLLQSTALILECTPTAMESSWAQDQLQSFVKSTGFRMQQKILHLHKSWPARRDRWWCILSHPQLPAFVIHDLPELRFFPTIAHLIPRMLKIPDEHPNEIELGENEYSQFLSFPRKDSHIINVHAGLPTATHSWGSQLVGCECKCRKQGFATSRLQSKGLYAVLTTTGNMIQVNGDEMPELRHLLAQEVALMNGLPPSYVTPTKFSHLRLDLAGTGQMASPLQSGWVLGCMYHQLEQCRLARDTIHPRHLFANMCKALFEERDRIWKVTQTNKYMEILHREIDAIDRPIMYPPNEDDEEIDPLEIQKVCEQAEGELAKEMPDTSNFARSHKGKGGLIPNQPVQRVDTPNTQKEHSSLDQMKHQSEVKYSNRGGIPGFETRKRSSEESRSSVKRQCPAPPEKITSVPLTSEQTEHHPQPTSQLKEVSSKAVAEETKSQVCWIVHAEMTMQQIKFQGNPTIGQLEKAEASISDEHKVFRPTTSVGHKLPISSLVQDQQIIVLDNDINTMYRCPFHQDTMRPNVQGLPRAIALWSQRGWVASDEMEFYLKTMQSTQNTRIVNPIILEDREPIDAAAHFKESIIRVIHENQDEVNHVATALFFANHWAPLSVSWDSEIHIATSHELQTLIQEWIQHFFDDQNCTVTSVTVPQVFDADCGFQTVAWLLTQIEPEQTKFPMQPTTAELLRRAFAVHIAEKDIEWHPFCNQVLGGMPSETQIKMDLQALLESHGVNPQRSLECRDHLIQSLGTAAIRSAISSARPWKEIKTRASQHRPPIQIVQADELKTMVDARIANGKQIGKKAQKKQQKTNSVSVKIDADKIMLPPAIFQQTDGTQLQQITTRQFGPGCKGVAVVNIDEAVAFFQLKEPISNEGVAMLILDLQDERLPAHQQISFPATCPGTEEPVLLTAALVQLGNQQVTRIVPSDRIKIQESLTEVIRVTVYRDQFADEWSDFAAKPVRAILAHDMFGMMDKESVVDVWDRQFLSKQYQKMQPHDAELFVVTLRLLKPIVDHLQAQSGQSGMYFEPRNDCGRSPRTGFQVIWLPRKTLTEVIVACQVLPHQGWVVRHGDRYGLRVAQEHAQKTHETHRPDICYLGGQNMQTYKIGPLPYGTTRKSLVALFAEWQWTARPGQPIGQTQNHQGVFWTVQSCQSPSHWVFNMQHGDILISMHASPKENTKPSKGLLVASKRTLEAITTHPNQNQAMDKTPQDPLTKDDPWMAYKNSQKGVSVSQIAAIESNVQQRVIATLQNKTSEDVPMEGVVDSRVSQLESQVKHLTENFQSLSGSVSSYQQQQAHVNSQIANQINGVKSQMDKQNNQMQQILDSKMEEQMSRIEALLMKRHKSQE